MKRLLGPASLLGLINLAWWTGCAGPPSVLGPERPSPDAPLVGSLLCVSVHLPLGNAPQDEAERAWQLDHLEALGVKLIRRDVLWHEIEPVPNELHWERLDPGLADIRARGLELIALLAYGNPWASSLTDDDPMYPPDDPADFARFAGRVAERWGDEVTRFEIWNEQNAGWRFWKPRPEGDPEAYGALLHATAAAIREARPEATIIYGGTFYHDVVISPGTIQYLTDHLTAWPGAVNDFDGFGFHPYPMYPPSVPPEWALGDEIPFGEMMAQVQATLRDYGADQRPIWVTEFGWPSYRQVSRADQAAWLVRGAIWLAAAQARSACWYTLKDGRATGTYPPESDFGLIDWDVVADAPGTPKPSYYALLTLSQILGDTAFIRPARRTLESATNPAHAFLFGTRDGMVNVHVLWTVESGATAEARVPARGGAISVRNWNGETLPFHREGDDVVVTVDASPIYVIAHHLAQR